MADIPNAAPTNASNETRTLPTFEEIIAIPTSPTQGFPDPLYYMTGEARVMRTRGENSRASRTGPYQNPVTTGTRRHAYPRRWDWLPTTLNTWRSEEAIQIPTDPMDISPYTQEPLHHTVPVLAARLHRHEEQLEDMERGLCQTRMYWMRQAHDRIAQLFQDQENLTQTMDMVHQQVIDDRGEVDILQARLEECELRSQEAEQYTRVLEQRLTLAEENARQASSLAEAVDQLITLLPQVNLRRD